MRNKRVNDRARPKHWVVRKKSSADWAAEAAAFLTRVWHLHRGYVFLATPRATGRFWEEHGLEFPVPGHEVERLLRAPPRLLYDLYFCPNAFTKPRRLKRYAASTPYAWCDIDDGDPRAFRPPP